MNKSHFAANYSSCTNFQLYEILQNKGDYQEVALQAAQEELDKRQLSESEMVLVIEEWNQLTNKKLSDEKKKREFEDKIKNYKDKAITDLDPFTPVSTDRTIRMICLSIGIIYLLTCYGQFRSLLFSIKHYSPELLPLFATYLPIIFVPVGIWKFWQKKKTGWIIIFAWLTIMLGQAMLLLFSSFFLTVFVASNHFGSGLDPLLDQSGPAIVIGIISVAVFGYLFFYLLRKSIASIFNVTSNTKFYTLLTTFTLGICYFIISTIILN